MLENVCMFIDSIASFVCKTIAFLFKLAFFLIVGAIIFYYVSIIPASVWLIWALIYCTNDRPCSCSGQADQHRLHQ